MTFSDTNGEEDLTRSILADRGYFKVLFKAGSARDVQHIAVAKCLFDKMSTIQLNFVSICILLCFECRPAPGLTDVPLVGDS